MPGTRQIFERLPDGPVAHSGSGSNEMFPWTTFDTAGPGVMSTGGDCCIVRLDSQNPLTGTGSPLVVILSNLPIVFSGLSWLAGTGFGNAPSASIPSIGAVMDGIRDRLSITMSQLATALCLTRPTLYKWYEGRQPHAGNLTRLAALEKIASAWQRENLPFMRRLWDRRIPEFNCTIGEWLSGETLDVENFLAALPQIKLAVGSRPVIEPLPPRKRSGFRPRSTALSELSPPTTLFDEE